MWQGGRYDATTGLYNFRNRDYNPALGTWIEEDDGYWDGTNLLQYEGSDPESNVDPLGRADIPIQGEKWGLKIGADLFHKHSVSPQEAKDLKLPPGVNDLGPHLHGPNGQKFFPKYGIIMDKNGKKQRASGKFLKSYETTKCKLEKALKKSGLEGLLTLVALTANEMTGTNTQLAKDIEDNIIKMKVKPSGYERNAAATQILQDAQQLFGNDLAADKLMPILLDAANGGGQVDPAAQEFNNLDLTNDGPHTFWDYWFYYMGAT